MSNAGDASSLPAIAVTAAVGAVVLLLFLMCSITKKTENDGSEQETNEKKSKTVKQDKLSVKKSKSSFKTKKGSQVLFSHPWLCGTLKGHGSPILDLDISPNGKYVISTAEDRSVMLWSTKDFPQKEHKYIRCNIELDHATRISFSPDNKAFVVCLGNANTLRIYRIGKKDDGSVGNFTSAFDFPQKHKSEIINIGLASNGKYIMTCSSDTSILIWDIKGEILGTIDTLLMSNSFGAVSPCGRFVGASGFTPDVKVWEICFDKGGAYKEIKRAFELKGHSAGIHSFAFNNDSSRMASVSKDGTWKYWDTNVNYKMGQDTYLLHTGKLELSSIPSRIALSPDGRSISVSVDNNIEIFNAVTGGKEESMKNVHTDPITSLTYDISGKYILSAGDRHIQVIHNITGYKATIADLLDKERNATGGAMRERIRKQIQEARTSLQTLLAQPNGTAESK